MGKVTFTMKEKDSILFSTCKAHSGNVIGKTFTMEEYSYKLSVSLRQRTFHMKISMKQGN